MRWILACALLSAGAVQAADDPVESAKALAAEGKTVEAATVLGKAIAKLQRSGSDLPGVIDLCDQLVEIVGSKVGPCDDPAKGDT